MSDSCLGESNPFALVACGSLQRKLEEEEAEFESQLMGLASAMAARYRADWQHKKDSFEERHTTV